MSKKGYTFRIQNFQAIRDLTIDLWGFTALTGPTDRGKSAIVRALNCVLHNHWDASWITAGQDQTTLTLDLHEHPIIRQIKLEKNPSKGINTYTITKVDGTVETNPKSGKTTPDSMKEAGIKILTTERGQEINTNMQDQHDGIFLLKATETQVTDMFNALFGTNLIEAALLRANKDAQSINRAHGEVALGLQAAKQSGQVHLENANKLESFITTSSGLREQFNQCIGRAKNVEALAEDAVKAGHDSVALDQSIFHLREQRGVVATATELLRRYFEAAGTAGALERTTQAVNDKVATAAACTQRVELIKKLSATVNYRLRVEKPVIDLQHLDRSHTALVQSLDSARVIRAQLEQAKTPFQRVVAAMQFQAEEERIRTHKIVVPMYADEKKAAMAAFRDSVRKFYNTSAHVRNLDKQTAEVNNKTAAIDTVKTQQAYMGSWFETVVTPNTAKCNYCDRPIPKVA